MEEARCHPHIWAGWVVNKDLATAYSEIRELTRDDRAACEAARAARKLESHTADTVEGGVSAASAAAVTTGSGEEVEIVVGTGAGVGDGGHAGDSPSNSGTPRHGRGGASGGSCL
jgi:hypothetical protein